MLIRWPGRSRTFQIHRELVGPTCALVMYPLAAVNIIGMPDEHFEDRFSSTEMNMIIIIFEDF